MTFLSNILKDVSDGVQFFSEAIEAAVEEIIVDVETWATDAAGSGVDLLHQQTPPSSSSFISDAQETKFSSSDAKIPMSTTAGQGIPTLPEGCSSSATNFQQNLPLTQSEDVLVARCGGGDAEPSRSDVGVAPHPSRAPPPPLFESHEVRQAMPNVSSSDGWCLVGTSPVLATERQQAEVPTAGDDGTDNVAPSAPCASDVVSTHTDSGRDTRSPFELV